LRKIETAAHLESPYQNEHACCLPELKSAKRQGYERDNKIPGEVNGHTPSDYICDLQTESSARVILKDAGLRIREIK
jgi:hypothetical protein